ncbi:hypothetical protein [uncultured Chryseobacterium sp.]|uniref:hypothetical protein n=1 Tax=uncultured Chryseobacterium sp. TaxID=259322 RepID=UPI002582FB32|nr:hypothetical protein [uncultured Chryseobacterium sp.]
MATILPCLDRILCWIWPSLDVIEDNRGVVLSINIWQGCLYLSSVFIAIAAFFNPSKKLYYFPIAINAYSAIVYFAPIFGFQVRFLALNSWLAGIMSIVITYPIMLMLKHVRYLSLEERATDDFQADLIVKIKKLDQENKKLKHQIRSKINHED